MCAAGGEGKTGFGRAIERLGIELINARTPQAEGQTERANQTPQDRLMKEMRLIGISSIAAARCRGLAIERKQPVTVAPARPGDG